jgi:hypothetical protein
MTLEDSSNDRVQSKLWTLNFDTAPLYSLARHSWLMLVLWLEPFHLPVVISLRANGCCGPDCRLGLKVDEEQCSQFDDDRGGDFKWLARRSLPYTFSPST